MSSIDPNLRQKIQDGGSVADKQFLAHVDARQSAGTMPGLLRSMVTYAFSLGLLFCCLALYLYAHRVWLLRPVTGDWYGTVRATDGDASCIYVSTGVNPLSWFRPGLRGEIQVGDGTGQTRYAVTETQGMSDQTVGFTFVSAADGLGGIFLGRLEDGRLQVILDGAGPQMLGTARRGSLKQFQQQCQTVR
jgi:hypothetical protein